MKKPFHKRLLTFLIIFSLLFVIPSINQVFAQVPTVRSNPVRKNEGGGINTKKNVNPEPVPDRPSKNILQQMPQPKANQFPNRQLPSPQAPDQPQICEVVQVNLTETLTNGNGESAEQNRTVFLNTCPDNCMEDGTQATPFGEWAAENNLESEEVDSMTTFVNENLAPSANQAPGANAPGQREMGLMFVCDHTDRCEMQESIPEAGRINNGGTNPFVAPRGQNNRGWAMDGGSESAEEEYGRRVSDQFNASDLIVNRPNVTKGKAVLDESIYEFKITTFRDGPTEVSSTQWDRRLIMGNLTDYMPNAASTSRTYVGREDTEGQADVQQIKDLINDPANQEAVKAKLKAATAEFKTVTVPAIEARAAAQKKAKERNCNPNDDNCGTEDAQRLRERVEQLSKNFNPFKKKDAEAHVGGPLDITWQVQPVRVDMGVPQVIHYQKANVCHDPLGMGGRVEAAQWGPDGPPTSAPECQCDPGKGGEFGQECGDEGNTGPEARWTDACGTINYNGNAGAIDPVK